MTDQSLSIAENAREQGIESYPPLTRELAKVHALLGDHEKALELHSAAVAQGWRQLYLEGTGPLDTVGRLLAQDTRYLDSVAELESDLERMRRSVRRNGWAMTPDEFFTAGQTGEL